MTATKRKIAAFVLAVVATSAAVTVSIATSDEMTPQAHAKS